MIWDQRERRETGDRQQTIERNRQTEGTSNFFERQFSQRRKAKREEEARLKMSLEPGDNARQERPPFQRRIRDKDGLPKTEIAKLQGERQPAQKRRRTSETDQGKRTESIALQRDIRSLIGRQTGTSGLVQSGSTSERRE